MSGESGEPTSAVMSLHLQMPETRGEPVARLDRDESSTEEAEEEIGDDMPEEDAQSVIGFSISKAQTRLTSPRTPAAEKAAALASMDGMLFNGALDDCSGEWDRQAVQKILSPESEGHGSALPTSTSRKHDEEMPSPWRATPQTFTQSKSSQDSNNPLLATSMTPDINIKRYLSNLSLPSMPKTPNFKDFSVPSLSSILNNARSHSPLRKGTTRSKRASTYVAPSSSLDSAKQSESDLAEIRRGRRDTLPVQGTVEGLEARGVPINAKGGVEGSIGHPRAASDLPIATQQQSRLRRSTSDQSLLLRRATSTVTTLGDDSRWENVQEMVNSRMKAIMDSLQDSSIKLPSIPNLANLNLGSFLPDFTRSRANSEAKQPLLASSGQQDSDSSIDMTNGDPSMVSRDVAKSSNLDAYQANRKASKPINSYLEKALENLTGDIVLMGGYRGSVLRSAKPPHRQQWVPVKVGLNLRRVNLEVGLQPEDEENMEEYIFASGMLTHIGPVDMGRRLLKRLQTCKSAQEGKIRVHDYGYDWRLSPHLLSKKLITFLEGLQCNATNVPRNEKGAIIIAHSMGGLITRHAVNQRPELFAGVLYAGVPQYCINILGPFRNGDAVLFSHKVLTAQVNFTLRSSYLLLPDDGKCFINKVTKEEYKVDFFDVEHWKRYAWSPCIAPALPTMNPPEKGLFSSVSDLLPSLPSLPLPGRKESETLNLSIAAHNASTDIQDATDAAMTRALDPQFSHSSILPSNSSSTACTIPLQDAVTYLDRTLNETLVFRSQLAHNPCHTADNLYPPNSLIYATNTPTVAAARVSSREAISRADAYDDLQFASGDGVCLAKAAMLPEGYRCAEGGRIRTERGHVGLLGDLEAVGRCLLAMIRERRRGVGLGVEESVTEASAQSIAE